MYDDKQGMKTSRPPWRCQYNPNLKNLEERRGEGNPEVRGEGDRGFPFRLKVNFKGRKGVGIPPCPIA